MDKIYLCIDLKTFYASVECVERGLDPFKTDLIVADPSRSKGAICLAITPKMKERGIKNRCRVYEIPKTVHPIVAKPRMKKYIEYSVRIYQIYLKYVSKDDIHPYSIDEVFMDITNYLHLYKKEPVDIAKMIMKDIYDTTGITATAGIGTNLFLAKVALDIKSKHVDSHIGVFDEETFQKEMWHHLPITDFWQISYGTEARLHKLHLRDLYDVAHCNPKILYKEFGVNALYLIDHSWGRESCTIEDIKKYKPKSNSLSNSQILYRDYNYKEARIVLAEMIDNLVLQLVNIGMCTNNLSFYIGYSKDVIRPVACSFKVDDTSSYKIILNRILEEYDYRINESVPIRKIGLSFNNLHVLKYEQMNLFSNNDTVRDNKLETTILEIKNKYGKNSILRGISYLDGATQIDRNRLIGGHNAE